MADANKPWSKKDKTEFSGAFNKGPSGKDILEKVANLFTATPEPQAPTNCPNCGHDLSNPESASE